MSASLHNLELSRSVLGSQQFGLIFSSLKSIVTLDLSYTNFSITQLKSITSFHNLASLTLKSVKGYYEKEMHQNDFVDVLRNMHLQLLDLSGNEVTPSGILHLFDGPIHKSLRKLMLNECRSVDEEVISSVNTSLLTELQLKNSRLFRKSRRNEQQLDVENFERFDRFYYQDMYL